jgi:hypothetical protein
MIIIIIIMYNIPTATAFITPISRSFRSIRT